MMTKIYKAAAVIAPAAGFLAGVMSIKYGFMVWVMMACFTVAAGACIALYEK